MDDLIERLRDPPSVHEFDGERLLYALCSEAAAALESAREDAERYRWLRMRIGGREHVEDEFRYEYQDGEELAREVDAALDAEREGRE